MCYLVQGCSTNSANIGAGCDESLVCNAVVIVILLLEISAASSYLPHLS
jgi:hypothetical protein